MRALFHLQDTVEAAMVASVTLRPQYDPIGIQIKPVPVSGPRRFLMMTIFDVGEYDDACSSRASLRRKKKERSEATCEPIARYIRIPFVGRSR